MKFGEYVSIGFNKELSSWKTKRKEVNWVDTGWRSMKNDGISWHVLISDYDHHMLNKEGIVLVSRMMNYGIEPNQVNLLLVLSRCDPNMQVKSIHTSAAWRWSIMLKTSFIASIISMYGRLG